MSALFNQAETAVQMSPSIMMPFVVFGGFMTNAGTIPDWINWLQYLSPVRYGFEALIYNEFEDRTDIPQSRNPITFLNFNLGYGVCMILLLCIAMVVRIISVFLLKFKVSRF